MTLYSSPLYWGEDSNPNIIFVITHKKLIKLKQVRYCSTKGHEKMFSWNLGEKSIQNSKCINDTDQDLSKSKYIDIRDTACFPIIPYFGINVSGKLSFLWLNPRLTGNVTPGRKQRVSVEQCVSAPVILAHRVQHLLWGKGCRAAVGTNRESFQPKLGSAESHLYKAQTVWLTHTVHTRQEGKQT